MITWLSRQEKVSSFDSYLNDGNTTSRQLPPKLVKSIPKYPNYPNRILPLIQEKHKAPDFIHSLKIFINKLSPKPLPQQQLIDTGLPFTKVDVYNMFRFSPTSISDDDTTEKDVVKALPISSKLPHGRFDTVVVIINDEAESTGLIGNI